MTRINPVAAARRASIVRMRAERRTFADIGARLGISAQQAHRLYEDQLQREPVQALAEHRAEELALIDAAVRDLLGIATDRTQSARSRIEAWSVIRSWAERRAKLCGLDAPVRQRIEVVTTDVVEQAIRELEAEIAEGAAIEAAEAAGGAR